MLEITKLSNIKPFKTARVGKEKKKIRKHELKD